MPNIDQIIAAKKESLNPRINAILPSEGIPGNSGGGNSTLTAWTEIVIYPDGQTKTGRVIGGSGSSPQGGTWVLPLPQDLSEPHSLQYEPIEFGAIARMGASLLGNAGVDESKITDANSADSAEKNINSFDFSTAFANLGIAIGEEVLGYFTNQQVINFLRGRLRNTANPNMENMFKTANLRTFQFSWNLTPLNQDDARSIKNFISVMKKNIYPQNQEIGLGWNRLKFPAEFELTFNATSQNGGSQKIFKTAPCVCTEFVIQYTPNGAFNTHIDGQPTTVLINATFQEMYALHRGDIESL